MKYKHLRFSLLSMLLMLCGGLAWADEKTETLTTNTSEGYAELTVVKAGTSSTGSELEIQKGDIVVTSDKGYIKNHEMSVYKTGQMTVGFKAGVDAYITKVVLTVKNFHFAKPSGWSSTYTNDVTTKIDKADETETFTTTATDKSSLTLTNDKTGKVTAKVIAVTYVKNGSTTTERIATSIIPGDWEATGSIGEPYQLPDAPVSYTDATGTHVIEGAVVTWSSSDPSIAVINDDGKTASLIKQGDVELTASYEGNDTYEPASTTLKITVFGPAKENIAALTTETETGNYYLNFTDAVVTYVNGNYAYIQDASGAIVMYRANHGLVAGQTLNGKAHVSYQVRNGNPQITYMANVTPTSGTAPEPTTVAAADWNTPIASVLSQYFKVTGATITQESGKYYVQLGDEKVQLYGQGDARNFSLTDLSITYTITGFPTMYNETEELQIFVVPEAESAPAPVVALDNIAALTAQTAGNYDVTLSNAVVTYVNGSYAYIQDASGAVLYYNANHGLTAGQTLNGTAQVTLAFYKNNPQITSLSVVEATDGEAPEPTAVAAADWDKDFTAVLSQYFKVTGATITEESGKYYVQLGSDNVQIFGRADANPITVEDPNATYSITGFPTLFNDTKELTLFVQPEKEETVEPQPALPGVAIWTSEEPTTIAWDGAINISADKFANAKVGDRIHVEIVNPSDGGQVLPKSNWKDIDGSVAVNKSTTEVSFVITGDMMKFIKAGGLMVSGQNCSTKLVTLETTDMTGSDESIWVGQANGSGNFPINYIHFVNANNGEGVKAGDILRITATEADGDKYLQLFEPSWKESLNAEGMDITITEAFVEKMKAQYSQSYINFGGYNITQVEFIAGEEPVEEKHLYAVGGMNDWNLQQMMELSYNEETKAFEYEVSPTQKFYFAISDVASCESWEAFAEHRYAIAAGDAQPTLGEPVQLVVATDGTIVLNPGSYKISITDDLVMTITGEETLVENTYVVAGSSPEIFGQETTWNPTAEANKMTKAEGANIYTKTYTDITLQPGTIQYKIVGNGNDWYGNGNDNYTCEVVEAGIYTVEVTFDESTKTATMTLTKTGDAEEEEPTYVVAGSSEAIFGTTWNATAEANQMTKDETTGLYTKTYEGVQLTTAEAIEFKVVKNGSEWMGNAEGNNVSYTAEKDGTYDLTITFNPETKEISVTATPAGSVEPAPEYVEINVDGSISQGGFLYTTYSSQYPLDFTNVENVTAYVAKKNINTVAETDQLATIYNDVILTPVTMVPANTGIIVKVGPGCEPGIYNVPVAADDAQYPANEVEALANNDLIAAIEGKTDGWDNVLVLYSHKSESGETNLGFFFTDIIATMGTEGSETVASFQGLPPNSAYLLLNTEESHQLREMSSYAELKSTDVPLVPNIGIARGMAKEGFSDMVLLQLNEAKVTYLEKVDMLNLVMTIETLAEKYFDEEPAKTGLVGSFAAPRKVAPAKDSEEPAFEVEVAIIEDETGAMPVIGCNLAEVGAKKGSTLSGSLAILIDGSIMMFGASDSFDDADGGDKTQNSLANITITDGEALPLEITEENVSEYSANYDFKYVKIKDAEFTPATDEQLATVKLELTGETVPVVDILGTEATATEEGTAVIEGYMFDLAGIKLFQPTSMELTSTGIANTTDMLTGSEGATYNLNGQRVDKSYRGVVIRNGRKYIKK